MAWSTSVVHLRGVVEAHGYDAGGIDGGDVCLVRRIQWDGGLGDREHRTWLG